MKIVLSFLVFLMPLAACGKPIELHEIKNDNCLNCFFIANSPINEGSELKNETNKKNVYGEYYEDYLLEFGGKFYYFYRIELSNEDGRDYMALRVISVGHISNVKAIFFLNLSPYELFDNYDDFEGRNIKFIKWINKDTFKLKINEKTYAIKLFLKLEKQIISVSAQSAQSEIDGVKID